VTDGTAAGTRLVIDLDPGPASSLPGNLTAFQGSLYFTTKGSESLLRSPNLWRTDGTEAGTVQVEDISPSFGSNPASLTEHAGRLWFFAEDDTKRGLWSTDGTAKGTRPEALLPSSGSVDGGRLIWDGDRLFFSGTATDLGDGLFLWDGSPGGLRHISDAGFLPDPAGQSVPVVSAGILYFSGGFNLWRSDGTEAGTFEVRDQSGVPIDEPEFFQAFAGSVFFTTRQNLYQTDGTSAGTSAILGLSSPVELRPQELIKAGPRLFFSKWDPATGSELWALEAN
jgi:ELWxxDGT repeat protein